jgi:hypothetical protein
VFSQDDNVLIDTARTVQLWFEEHKGELQHLPWPVQSPDLDVIEPLSSVLKTRVRNGFLPLKSVNQLEDVVREKWYKIPLETAENLYESIPKRIASILKAKGVQHHINKELCTIIIVF